MKESIDAVIEYRQNLMFSYVFAFYVKASEHKATFKTYQSNLETSVSTLMGYLQDVFRMVDKSKNSDHYLNISQEMAYVLADHFGYISCLQTAKANTMSNAFSLYSFSLQRL